MIHLNVSFHYGLYLTLYILQMWSSTFKVHCSFFLPPDFTSHYKTIIIITFLLLWHFCVSLCRVLCKELLAGWREESEIFYLGYCKIGGFTAKLVCSERSPLSSVKLPAHPRSASVSGDSSLFICYEGSAFSLDMPCLLTILLHCLDCLVWSFGKLQM